jgi:hypothetical protein
MKINIVMTKCKRCGKPLAKTNKSLYGIDEAKIKYGDICSTCITKEEEYEILQEQVKIILR